MLSLVARTLTFVQGHVGVVEALVAAGADANQLVKSGRSPLHMAAQDGHHAVAQVCE